MGIFLSYTCRKMPEMWEQGEMEIELLCSSLTLCLWLSGTQNIMTMDMGRFKILMKLMVCLYFHGGQSVQVSACRSASDRIIGGCQSHTQRGASRKPRCW